MASRLMTKAVLGVAVLAAFSMMAVPALAAQGEAAGDCDQTQQKDMAQDGSGDACQGDCPGDGAQQRDRDRDMDGSCAGSNDAHRQCHCLGTLEAA